MFRVISRGSGFLTRYSIPLFAILVFFCGTVFAQDIHVVEVQYITEWKREAFHKTCIAYYLRSEKDWTNKYVYWEGTGYAAIVCPIYKNWGMYYEKIEGLSSEMHFLRYEARLRYQETFAAEQNDVTITGRDMAGHLSRDVLSIINFAYGYIDLSMGRFSGNGIECANWLLYPQVPAQRYEEKYGFSDIGMGFTAGYGYPLLGGLTCTGEARLGYVEGRHAGYRLKWNLGYYNQIGLYFEYTWGGIYSNWEKPFRRTSSDKSIHVGFLF